jgi:hypothetical protein
MGDRALTLTRVQPASFSPIGCRRRQHEVEQSIVLEFPRVFLHAHAGLSSLASVLLGPCALVAAA